MRQDAYRAAFATALQLACVLVGLWHAARLASDLRAYDAAAAESAGLSALESAVGRLDRTLAAALASPAADRDAIHAHVVDYGAALSTLLGGVGAVSFADPRVAPSVRALTGDLPALRMSMEPTDIYRSLSRARDVARVLHAAYRNSDARRHDALTAARRDAVVAAGAFILALIVFVLAVGLPVLRHLRRLAAEVEAERARAAKATRDRYAFAANAGHEIRTALNGVLGMVDLMQAEQGDPPSQERLAILKRSAGALLEVVNSVLDFAKTSDCAMRIETAPFDLRRTLDACVETFRGSAAHKGLALSLTVAAGAPPSVLGDALRLRQILANLISNAIKFTSQGHVSVDASWLSDLRLLEVTVSDSGIGVPRDQREAIFERFAQLRTEVFDQSKGTGLGLALCRSLTHAMGGRLTVHDAPGGGATFRLRIPLAPVLSRPDEQTASAMRVAVDSTNSTRRVMIVAMLRHLDCPMADAPDPQTDVVVMDGCDGTAARAAAVRAAAPGAAILALGTDTPPPWADASRTVAPDAAALHAALVEAREGRAAAAATRAAARNDAQALIVDDNEINLTVAAAMMTTMGHACETAPDGAAAVRAHQARLTEGQRLDVVLMDVSMPVMDGIEATRRIRAVDAAVPIIGVTGHMDPATRDRCHAAGMNAVLGKPLTREALEAALTSVIVSVSAVVADR